MLCGRKPDYNANNFAVNPRFLKQDEKCALWRFSTENSLKQASFLLLSLQWYKVNKIGKGGKIQMYSPRRPDPQASAWPAAPPCDAEYDHKNGE